MQKCPTDQQLAEYVDQQSIGEERHVIEQHLVDCDRCLRQVGFLVRSIGVETSQVPEGLLQRARQLGSTKQNSSVFPWGWATLATGALAGVLVIFTVANRPARHRDTTGARGSSAASSQPATPAIAAPTAEAPAVRGTETSTSQMLLFPQPGQTVRSDDLFRWNVIPGAVSYELQVLEDTGDVIWEMKTRSTSTKLPREIHLQKGRTYYARLKVHPNHDTIDESKTVPFIAG